MLWSVQQLTVQNYKENIQCIKNLYVNQFNNGYDYSSCDSLLLLVGQIYIVSINRLFSGTEMEYTNIKSDEKICVKSNYGHYWNEKTKHKKYNKHHRKY